MILRSFDRKQIPPPPFFAGKTKGANKKSRSPLDRTISKDLLENSKRRDGRTEKRRLPKLSPREKNKLNDFVALVVRSSCVVGGSIFTQGDKGKGGGEEELITPSSSSNPSVKLLRRLRRGCNKQSKHCQNTCFLPPSLPPPVKWKGREG